MKFDAAYSLLAPVLAFAAGHPLLERPLVASLELFVLAALTAALLALTRPRSARLRALCWLVVLAKPIGSLLLGSPFGGIAIDVAAPVEAALRSDPTVGAGAGGPPTQTTETQTTEERPGDDARAAAADAPAVEAGSTSAGGDAARRATTAVARVPPVATSAATARRSWFTAGVARTVVLAAWLVGVALLVTRSLLDRRRVRAFVARATPADDPLVELAAATAQRIGVARTPCVLRSDELDSPALVGVTAPIVLLPTWMEDPRDLRWSLRHELMHFALRDPFAAHVRELAQILFFFHPAAWFAGRKWEEATELACDRAIVSDVDESLDYADRLCAIAQVVKQHAAPALGPGFLLARSRVGRRLEALLKAPLAASARLGRGGTAAVALLAFATLAFGARLQSAPKSDPQKTAPGVAANGDGAADDVVKVHGRVLDPDGKPVADAPVEIVHGGGTRLPRPVLTRTRTDRDGRFVATVRKDRCADEIPRHEAWRELVAATFVDGFGPGWETTWQKSLDAELTLRLARDLPVHGRVVDLEGRPVANAAVRVTEIVANVKEDLGPYLASVRARDPAWKSWLFESAWRFLAPVSGHAWTATTDAKGGFEIRGLGAHRIAHLEVRSDPIALLRAMLVTEPLERPLEGDGMVAPDAQQIHGVTLELVAQPTRPIEGVVRASDGGAPMADVEVASAQFAGSMWADEGSLTTTTDEAGRFRIVGMPKGKGNHLSLRPNDEQPYFQANAEVPDRPGLETIEMEVTLERGIWITGRVTEAKSGKPARGCVHYLPLFSNPFMQKRPQLAPGGLSMVGDQRRYPVAADGTYRIVGLPGPAAIGVTNDDRYRQGVGFEAFAGESRGSYGITYFNPVPLGPSWPTSMARIDPPADATSATCDLVLDRGESVALRCVDDAGQLLSDFEVCGLETHGTWTPIASSALVVDCLGPAEQRPVAIRQRDRKLGRYALVSLANGKEQTLTLLPLVTVIGRILDASGDPVRRALVTGNPRPEHDFETATVKILADEAGRFRFEALPCGTDWQISAEARLPGYDFPIPLAVGDVKEPKPGQVVDLGEVVLKPAN